MKCKNFIRGSAKERKWGWGWGGWESCHSDVECRREGHKHLAGHIVSQTFCSLSGSLEAKLSITGVPCCTTLATCSLRLGAVCRAWPWSKSGDEFQRPAARPLVSYASPNWWSVRCILVPCLPQFPKLLVPRNSEWYWNPRERGQRMTFSLDLPWICFMGLSNNFCAKIISTLVEIASCRIVSVSGGGHGYEPWSGRGPMGTGNWSTRVKCWRGKSTHRKVGVILG